LPPLSARLRPSAKNFAHGNALAHRAQVRSKNSGK
jgi:hypothetical protein